MYDGLNAQGAWTLEIQDDRAGATNPTPELLSWQLRFNYVTTGTSPNGIPPGSPQTNVIPAGSWAYYPGERADQCGLCHKHPGLCDRTVGYVV